MNKALTLILSLSLLLACWVLSGCKTSQNAIRTSSLSVEAMIKGYAIYVVANDIPKEAQDPVWDAYDKYKLAEDQAINAYTAFVVLGDQNKWATAREALRQANLALMKLFPPQVQPVN